jgi:5'-nucleotidase/UDP-sugar diphosphatase
MRKFSLRALALVALLVAACASQPGAAKPKGAVEIGSVDKSAVALLKNGKAKAIDIISINDFHAALEEEAKGKNPGIGKLATVILDAKKANPNTLFVSGGDNFQGSALSSITKGKIVAEFFKLVGLNASAVGNHELDWGLGNFDAWENDGGFDFLAANIKEKATGKAPAWADPYKIVKVGGHRIALIGLMTQETLTTVKADFVAPFDIVDPAQAAAALIPEILKKEKPELVIALTHVPSQQDKADPSAVLAMPAFKELDALCKVPGLDAVISGHSHNPVAGLNNKVPVIQAYYNGRDIAKLSVVFQDDGSKKVTPSFDEFYKNKGSIAENAAAKEIFASAMAKYGQALNDKVAVLDKPLSHDKGANVTPMGYWVCEVLRARYGLDAYVQNGGGLRKGFNAGDVLVKDFWELMPFDNYTVTFDVSGADLKKIIDHGIDSVDFGNGQFAGLVVTYDPAAAYESKVVSMTLADGTPVDDNKTYKVGTNDFQFSGGDKYVIKPYAKNVKETFEPVREMLLDIALKAKTIKVPDFRVLVPAAK